MKSLAIIPFVFALVLSSCATMSAQQKAQYLEQYRQSVAARTEQQLLGETGFATLLQKTLLAQETDPMEREKGEAILSRIFTHDRTKQLVDEIIEAELKAVNEVFTGKQIKYMVDFNASDIGKSYNANNLALKQKLILAMIEHDGDVPDHILASVEAASDAEEKKIEPLFSSGIGLSILKKRLKYLSKRAIYQNRVKTAFKEEMKATLIAEGYIPSPKAKPSH